MYIQNNTNERVGGDIDNQNNNNNKKTKNVDKKYIKYTKKHKNTFNQNKYQNEINKK